MTREQLRDSLSHMIQLKSTRSLGCEVWKAHAVMITDSGHVIGYTGKFLEKERKRVHLGYAMGCVKGEDTELLPLGNP